MCYCFGISYIIITLSLEDIFVLCFYFFYGRLRNVQQILDLIIGPCFGTVGICNVWIELSFVRESGRGNVDSSSVSDMLAKRPSQFLDTVGLCSVHEVFSQPNVTIDVEIVVISLI